MPETETGEVTARCEGHMDGLRHEECPWLHPHQPHDIVLAAPPAQGRCMDCGHSGPTCDGDCDRCGGPAMPDVTLPPTKTDGGAS